MKSQRGTIQTDVQRAMRCIMFADVSGFSKLTGESQIIIFWREVVKPIRAELDQFQDHIIEFNTWGDGLFVVFDTADAGCRFALKIRDLFRADFSSRGLSEDVNVRCALHLGEVIELKQALPGGSPFLLGDEITLAARIEPMVPPGEVWVTEAVASNRTVCGDKEVAFDELGLAELAKGYGTIKVFGLRRPNDAQSSPVLKRESNDRVSNGEIMATLGALYSDLVNRVECPDVQDRLAKFYSTAIELIRPA